jgi:hypothetical protein
MTKHLKPQVHSLHLTCFLANPTEKMVPFQHRQYLSKSTDWIRFPYYEVALRCSNGPPLGSILVYFTPVRTPTPRICIIHFNIIFSSTGTSPKWSSPFSTQTEILRFISIFRYELHADPRGRAVYDVKSSSATAHLLGLRVRIKPGALVSVSCKCCVLSDRGLCVGPIPRPEKYYRA